MQDARCDRTKKEMKNHGVPLWNLTSGGGTEAILRKRLVCFSVCSLVVFTGREDYLGGCFNSVQETLKAWSKGETELNRCGTTQQTAAVPRPLRGLCSLPRLCGQWYASVGAHRLMQTICWHLSPTLFSAINVGNLKLAMEGVFTSWNLQPLPISAPALGEPGAKH